MMNSIKRLEPNIGVASNEPSLEVIVFKYYNAWFDKEASKSLTNQYFSKLNDMIGASKSLPDYPDFNVSG